MKKKRIAILASGIGTNLQRVIDHTCCGHINGSVELVISDKKESFAMKRALNYGVKSIYIGKGNFPNPVLRRAEMVNELKTHDIDLIVLAGYLSILDDEFIKTFENRIINTHPSLIPSFCGMGFYGMKVHKAVHDYGAKVTGATVHFVNEIPDAGPIILQESVEVDYKDTPEVIQEKVLEIEHRLLPRAIELFCEDRLHIDGRRVIIT
ncbi:MAG: phosphoribosylglycinamide formyltransferase [Peptostreptococcaceae bacterium]|nr:phosphoribosylglycinamide formyltransferase [Peptostreptococcaceae bacterium]